MKAKCSLFTEPGQRKVFEIAMSFMKRINFFVGFYKDLRRLLVATVVLQVALVPVLGQQTPSGKDEQAGSIHGVVSTLQQDKPSGIAGIAVKLA